MDQNLLRSYLASVYEVPAQSGFIRVSFDGDVLTDPTALPEVLRERFAIVTAYNPRSMLLPRKVNEVRNAVLRDLLVLGCYRVESCSGFEDNPESSWREASWLVHDIDRREAIEFGRVFRQNTIVYCNDARPELIVTDPTCDDIGTTFTGYWRVLS